jgi:hypothetical protein
VQNIHYLTQEIAQNFQVEITLQQIKDWHKVLMRGLIIVQAQSNAQYDHCHH